MAAPASKLTMRAGTNLLAAKRGNDARSPPNRLAVPSQASGGSRLVTWE